MRCVSVDTSSISLRLSRPPFPLKNLLFIIVPLVLFSVLRAWPVAPGVCSHRRRFEKSERDWRETHARKR